MEVATRASLLSGQVAERLVALGVSGVTVEVNGLRGSRGGEWPRSPQASLAQIFQGATHARSRGIPTTAITRVHRGNIDQLTALQGRLKAEGFSRWVVQLAHSGSGSPDDSLAMLPRRRLPELATVLARLSGDPDLPPVVHSTIGYLSREEPILRTSGRLDPQTFWRGAPCGRSTLGVAPDGGIKGCSNQRGAPFEVGNLRDEPLRAIWQDRARWFWVDPAPALAGGSCGDCSLKADCGGGCPCVAHAVTGRIFDNPYCVRAVRRAQ